MKSARWAALLLVGAVAGVAAAMLLVNLTARQEEGRARPVAALAIDAHEVDPARWGEVYPRQFERFMMTARDGQATTYGGSEPYSKLERDPFLKTAYAGYGFALDYNEERGHHYAQIDQARSKRTTELKMPGACINCHAANAPALIEELGWERFNSTPYNDLRERLTHGLSCGDCHDPRTLQLRITRPAFANAMAARGVDVQQATTQQMRTWVCAQCHVEYYFKGEDKLLTFPWEKGTNVDAIAATYDELDFADWTHKLTGTRLIKIQHPEFELFSTSLHARSGVSCADCHMPYRRDGGLKVTDHYIRSPLQDVRHACGTCHRATDEALTERVLTIQHRNKTMVHKASIALGAAIDALTAAREAGASDAQLEDARRLHRQAQLRWDFVESENSAGFHSPQEAARVLLDATDLARQAELAAHLALPDHGLPPSGNAPAAGAPP